LNKAAG
jgi:ankyrin repeat protein